MEIKTHQFRLLGAASLLLATLWPLYAQAVPVTGFQSCAKPDQAPADCTFYFTGGRAAGVVPGGTTAGPQALPQYFVLNGFMMPHLETEKPASGQWDTLYMAQSIGYEAGNDWSDPVFVFDGFIDGMGNLNQAPEMQGDMVYWHGFAWHWEATCEVATTAYCGQLDVYSNITFKNVRIGDWIMVPEPAILTLMAVGIAGIAYRQRKQPV